MVGGGRRSRWNGWVQIFLIFVVVGEITFLFMLDRLDGLYFTPSIKSRLRSWKASQIYSFADSNFPGGSSNSELQRQWLVTKEITFVNSSTATKKDEADHSNSSSSSTGSSAKSQRNCVAWLSEADKMPGERNFSRDPIYVFSGESQVWDSCGVGCVFRPFEEKTDGIMRKSMEAHPPWRTGGTSHILRSMESSSYYPENDLDGAHRSGYDVVMTTDLASDVPVGYFSWAEYDIMGPMEAKTEEAPAVAFISNCAAHNFRLEALEALRNFEVQVDSYGKCHRNREAGNKLATLKRYKFSLAFENSNEPDYVTEKFWQSLVAGSVPVVVGAPNIGEFAPGPNTYLYISSMGDVSRVAQQMRYLAGNETAYNETLRWKYEGPSDSFKALVDMAAVHSSCRLCIHLATLVRAEEEKKNADAVAKRPCQCKEHESSGSVITYHIFVRERGRFQLESIFLKSTDLTVSGLEAAMLAKFKSMRHVPIWWLERPQKIRGDGVLRIYRVYPVGLTQRDALYSLYFHNDEDVRAFVEKNPCPKLEVIFV